VSEEEVEGVEDKAWRRSWRRWWVLLFDAQQQTHTLACLALAALEELRRLTHTSTLPRVVVSTLKRTVHGAEDSSNAGTTAGE
jgi:hypothetical protein